MPAAGERQAQDLGGICPYLVAEDGTWKAARAVREHHCSAVRPAVAVSIGQQRERCLVPAHVGCPAYLAARERRRLALEAAGVDAGRLERRRTVALSRPMPVALERPTAVPGSVAFVGGLRRAAQLGLVGLMIVAAAALYLARFAGSGLTGAAASATPPASLPVIAAPSPVTATPAMTVPPSPTGSPTPVPTLALTPSPPPTPAPTLVATRTYTVRRGDTLLGIARRFGTSVRVIQQLNDISNPRLIFAGQVLRIP